MEKRPDSVPGITYKITTSDGEAYITVNGTDKSPFEIFINIGKSGTSTMANAEAIGRLISLALRSGIDARDIIVQLTKNKQGEPVWWNHMQVWGIGDAAGKALKIHIGEPPGPEDGTLVNGLTQ